MRCILADCSEQGRCPCERPARSLQRVCAASLLHAPAVTHHAGHLLVSLTRGVVTPLAFPFPLFRWSPRPSEVRACVCPPAT